MIFCVVWLGHTACVCLCVLYSYISIKYSNLLHSQHSNIIRCTYILFCLYVENNIRIAYIRVYAMHTYKDVLRVRENTQQAGKKEKRWNEGKTPNSCYALALPLYIKTFCYVNTILLYSPSYIYACVVCVIDIKCAFKILFKSRILLRAHSRKSLCHNYSHEAHTDT